MGVSGPKLGPVGTGDAGQVQADRASADDPALIHRQPLRGKEGRQAAMSHEVVVVAPVAAVRCQLGTRDGRCAQLQFSYRTRRLVP
jgi:hypothetical protein